MIVMRLSSLAKYKSVYRINNETCFDFMFSCMCVQTCVCSYVSFKERRSVEFLPTDVARQPCLLLPAQRKLRRLRRHVGRWRRLKLTLHEDCFRFSRGRSKRRKRRSVGIGFSGAIVWWGRWRRKRRRRIKRKTRKMRMERIRLFRGFRLQKVNTYRL